MKRKTSIAFLSWALFLLLVVPFVPHHHHAGAMCLEVEHRVGGDSDLAHPHAGHDADDRSSCLEEQRFVAGEDHRTTPDFWLPICGGCWHCAESHRIKDISSFVFYDIPEVPGEDPGTTDDKGRRGPPVLVAARG
ncbi:DUF6769 family protein [uncultured Rikenella sp.]|uniref:DUF6769 family protein n=2 Tax=uncultured Rikenella sp. TaxID=368003 RepID=UPI00272BBA3B|nr:DUF6769 family protein [uncultured Rikenella sp.]